MHNLHVPRLPVRAAELLLKQCAGFVSPHLEQAMDGSLPLLFLAASALVMAGANS